MPLRALSVLVLVGSSAVACASEIGEPAAAPAGGEPANAGPAEVPREPAPQSVTCTKMDVVFVVSTGNGMPKVQDALAASLPGFVERLEAYRTGNGAPLDYRVAVTSGDTFLGADSGRFRSDCAGDGAKPWLDRDDGDVGAKLACRARVGGSSCIDRPLEAAKLSLTERAADGSNTWRGERFLRDDAVLALVVVTNEDEGGHVNAPAAPVSTYPPVLDALKRGPERWTATVVARDARCPADGAEIAEAARLKEFVGRIGRRGAFTPICAADFGDAMRVAFDTFAQTCGDAPRASVR